MERRGRRYSKVASICFLSVNVKSIIVWWSARVIPKSEASLPPGKKTQP